MKGMSLADLAALWRTATKCNYGKCELSSSRPEGGAHHHTARQYRSRQEDVGPARGGRRWQASAGSAHRAARQAAGSGDCAPEHGSLPGRASLGVSASASRAHCVADGAGASVTLDHRAGVLC